uniref:Uncharacterized protein n=1 Tax=Magallana gigas TaxID=29159 RepID=K1RHM9_MAGGI
MKGLKVQTMNSSNGYLSSGPNREDLQSGNSRTQLPQCTDPATILELTLKISNLYWRGQSERHPTESASLIVFMDSEFSDEFIVRFPTSHQPPDHIRYITRAVRSVARQLPRTEGTTDWEPLIHTHASLNQGSGLERNFNQRIHR